MNDLSKLISEKYQTGEYAMPLQKMKNIIQKNYCIPLGMKGDCIFRCELCRFYINEMMDLSKARNEAALLTWKARNEMAKAMDDWAAANRGNAPVYDEDFNFSVSGVGNLLMQMFE